MKGFADSPAVLRHLTVPVFLEFEDEPYVIVRVSGGDVKVEMQNRLSGAVAVVGEDVVAVKLKAFDRCLRYPVSGAQQTVER